ncbi:MAG: Gfo/Idh/MocA family oxidoreductase [Planctomycetes bacterium]|nr:Gfo/Idh/MocA family oxidoreductase [Planctomycetota bacterium]
MAAAAKTKRLKAPDLPYRPRDPKKYAPAIGLIGCGGITRSHLRAYKEAGYRVAALCDLDEGRAKERQKEFYPKARIYTDHRELLKNAELEVVDIATHPSVRAAQIEDALNARKHVLSQKPFVVDLDFGERMVALAAKKGVKLAVNQNGRWAPNWSYMREAVRAGAIGALFGAHLSVHWNHDYIHKLPFNEIRHAILYDFAIHWFDILACFMGDRKAVRVYGSCTRAQGQLSKPPLLGQALVEYEGAQASLIFDAFVPTGPETRTFLGGSKGSISSIGPGLNEQVVTLITEAGAVKPNLKGSWFPDGFHGTMAELLCAIEEKREPYNSGANNLKSLALCFAALASADAHEARTPGTVRTLAT